MIREAVVDDADNIADIIIKAWRTGFVGIIDSSYIKKMESEKYSGIFKDRISNKKETVLVYEKNNIIKGFVSGSMHVQNYCSELDGLYVYPKYQGCGIGTSLLRQIISIFKQNNCKNMVVWTLLGADNNEFYMRHGGTPKEYKEYEFDSKICKGVGYEFLY
jgi:GNAT superfamily N-acetyltransferase